MSEADVPLKGIIDLAEELVRTPSRSEDDPADVLGVISRWAKSRKLVFHDLDDGKGKTVGGFFHLESGRPGPSICLDACVDTCPFGATETWKHHPASGTIEGDTLYGRGASDSKVAVAMFCHIFEVISKNGLDSGQLYVLLDADEHSGGFGGVKAFLKTKPKLDAVFIGYPGNEDIKIGARGFLRARATVYGQAAHAGSSKPALDNAVVKMAQLISMISSTELPAEKDPLFTFGPKVTVTAINGGKDFSQVPDKVELNIDMRLTPSFNRANAEKWLQDIIRKFDAMNPTLAQSTLSFLESWLLLYALDAKNPAAAALQANAERELGRPVPLKVCGPSNIGNYLSEAGIPALCGFGVDYQNLHGANESIRLSSIEPVYNAYSQTIKDLCP